jgi:hypothetical protein
MIINYCVYHKKDKPSVRGSYKSAVPHEWSLGKGKTDASLPHKIYGEAISIYISNYICGCMVIIGVAM